MFKSPYSLTFPNRHLCPQWCAWWLDVNVRICGPHVLGPQPGHSGVDGKAGECWTPHVAVCAVAEPKLRARMLLVADCKSKSNLVQMCASH